MTSLTTLISAHFLRIEKLKMTKRDLTMGGSIVTHERGGKTGVGLWRGTKDDAICLCSCPKHQIAAFLSPPKQTDAYTSYVHQEMSGATHVPFKGLQIGPDKDPWEVFAYEKSLTCCGRGCAVGWSCISNRHKWL